MGFGLVFVAYTQLKQDLFCIVKFYGHYGTSDIQLLLVMSLFCLSEMAEASTLWKCWWERSSTRHSHMRRHDPAHSKINFLRLQNLLDYIPHNRGREVVRLLLTLWPEQIRYPTRSTTLPLSSPEGKRSLHQLCFVKPQKRQLTNFSQNDLHF